MLDIEFLNEKQDSTGEGTALWNAHVHARAHTGTRLSLSAPRLGPT